MKVTATITRLDLLRLNYFVMLRSKFWRMLSVVLFVFVVGFVFYIQPRHDVDSAILSFLIAVPATLFGALCLAIYLVICALFANNKSGLGERTYQIQDNGLQMQSEFGESTLNWSGLGPLWKTRKLIILKFNALNYFLIPMRAFSTQNESDSFFDALTKKIADGQDNVRFGSEAEGNIRH